MVASVVVLGVVTAALAVTTAAPPAPEPRGCRDRVEGPLIVPEPPGDTVIGPMAMIGLPGVYRDYASRPDSELRWRDGRMPSMKAIGILRGGKRVRLVVPRRQRRWMEVIYDFPHHRGSKAIVLRACRTRRSRRARKRECGWAPRLACRAGLTQFNGGVGLDFVNAPRRGLCAELIVRVRGRKQPLRERLFDPSPGECED